MVVPESETMSSQGEAESSPPRSQKKSNGGGGGGGNNVFSLLGRQSSIYSLTLDEFQHTLCDGGKNFGSMNMDEFLTSIWTAEETHNNHAAAAADHHPIPLGDFLSSDKGGPPLPPLPARQLSLSRQGSLTLPAPLCRKTVEEVWSEIHGKAAPEQSNGSNNNNAGIQQPHDGVAADARWITEAAPRQPTFGEMTLEDFLVKAGVVREQAASAAAPPNLPQPQPQPQPLQQYGMYVGGGTGAGGNAHGFSGGRAVNGAYPPHPPPAAAAAGGYGGRVANGGYGAGPVSPVSSDGMCGSQAENSGVQFGMDMAATMRGRKRVVDGPVEKVVERRQRRMIKNRESAARSRARKQAYTVELEAELNQLREENTHLKQALGELERKQKQQYFEEMKTKVQTKAYKAKEKMRVFRRNLSCPL